MNPEIEKRIPYKYSELTENQIYKAEDKLKTFVGGLSGNELVSHTNLPQPVGLETRHACDPSPTWRGENGITRQAEKGNNSGSIKDSNIQIPGE